LGDGKLVLTFRRLADGDVTPFRNVLVEFLIAVADISWQWLFLRREENGI
jgi:hypothetical protein